MFTSLLVFSGISINCELTFATFTTASHILAAHLMKWVWVKALRRLNGSLAQIMAWSLGHAGKAHQKEATESNRCSMTSPLVWAALDCHHTPQNMVLIYIHMTSDSKCILPTREPYPAADHLPWPSSWTFRVVVFQEDLLFSFCHLNLWSSLPAVCPLLLPFLLVRHSFYLLFLDP